MKRTLLIFEHKNGFHISTENLILILLTGIVFLLSYLHGTTTLDLGIWLFFLLIIWLFYCIGLGISTFFQQKNAYGDFNGKIELEKDSITIKESKYELNEINKITIHSNDHKGQYTPSPFAFTRHLSNGLNNSLKLKLSNGNEVNCYFLQTKGHRIKNFRDILINYHLKGKMSWFQLLNVLEIEDYDEIQSFKKKLKEIK